MRAGARLRVCAFLLGLALTFAMTAPVAYAVTPTLEPTGSMIGEHGGAVAAALPGGQVLIASGNAWKDPREMESYPTPKAEVYDPASGTFSETGQMIKGRYTSAAAPLASGEVLIAGGLYAPTFAAALDSAELYDPTSGTFSSTGSLSTPRWNHFAVTLADGRVLVGDGTRLTQNGVQPLATTEIYDPASGEFAPGPTLPTARIEPAAAVLPDGKVLIAGGIGADLSELSSSEIFDPCTGTSTVGPEMLEPGIARATTLTNGRVLVTIRSSQSSGHVYDLEEYDPVAGEFLATGISSGSIYGAALAPLPGGQALIAGRSGAAEEGTAARQAFVFSGIEAPEVEAPPICPAPEPAPAQSPTPVLPVSPAPSLPDSPVTGVPALAPTTSPTAPAPTTPPAAKGVSAAQAEGKRHRKHHRRHHKRHHGQGQKTPGPEQRHRAA